MSFSKPQMPMKKLLALSDDIAPEGVQFRTPSKRVAQPKLPPKRKLSPDEVWKSVIWQIDTAESHGRDALVGLALAYGRMIQASALERRLMDCRSGVYIASDPEDFFWEPALPIGPNGEPLKQLLSRSKHSGPIAFSEAIVIANIWEPWRLSRAFQTINGRSPTGTWRQDDNHVARAWYPWPIVWVANGNHSTTAAVVRGIGAIQCYEHFDASALLSAVTSDGISWIRVADNSCIGPVTHRSMAAIFEIGRRLCRFGDALPNSSRDSPTTPTIK